MNHLFQMNDPFHPLEKPVSSLLDISSSAIIATRSTSRSLSLQAHKEEIVDVEGRRQKCSVTGVIRFANGVLDHDGPDRIAGVHLYDFYAAILSGHRGDGVSFTVLQENKINMIFRGSNNERDVSLVDATGSYMALEESRDYPIIACISTNNFMAVLKDFNRCEGKIVSVHITQYHVKFQSSSGEEFVLDTQDGGCKLILGMHDREEVVFRLWLDSTTALLEAAKLSDTIFLCKSLGESPDRIRCPLGILGDMMFFYQYE